MNNIKLTSPDGKGSILCHPSKVAEMKQRGWKETNPAAPENTAEVANHGKSQGE